jgi:hypothetical protein
MFWIVIIDGARKYHVETKVSRLVMLGKLGIGLVQNDGIIAYVVVVVE